MTISDLPLFPKIIFTACGVFNHSERQKFDRAQYLDNKGGNSAISDIFKSSSKVTIVNFRQEMTSIDNIAFHWKYFSIIFRARDHFFSPKYSAETILHVDSYLMGI